MHLFALIFLSFLAGVKSTTSHKSYTCNDFIVPIPVDNVTTIVPPFPAEFDQYAATELLNLFTIRTPSVPDVNLTTLTKTFNISVEYCAPKTQGPESSTLFINTHGLGFNKSYWNFYLANATDDAQYSYIDRIAGAGYSTLSWSRLGIEPSTVADPLTEVQATVELALLAGLTTLARVGQLTGVAIPEKVIHVGHSWGSQLSLALAAVAPELSDGVVLTGYSNRAEYQGYFLASTGLRLASDNAPERFPADQYPPGYVTWVDKFANQYSFLEYPYFDLAVLDQAEATKYPFTLGELLTATIIPSAAPEFTGPVLYLAAEHDLIFCASNCTGLFEEDSPAIQAFNGSNNVEAIVLPYFGHGINLHKNATAAYDLILEWAAQNGF